MCTRKAFVLCYRNENLILINGRGLNQFHFISVCIFIYIFKIIKISKKYNYVHKREAHQKHQKDKQRLTNLK